MPEDPTSWLPDARAEQPGDVTDRQESRQARTARTGLGLCREAREFTIRIDGADDAGYKATVHVDGEWFADCTGPERHGVLNAATHYVLTA